MTVTQNDKAARFRASHEGPGAFVIPNPWDAGSSRIVASLGFLAGYFALSRDCVRECCGGGEEFGHVRSSIARRRPQS